MTTTLESAPLTLEDTTTVPYEEPEDASQHLTHIINPQTNTHIWHLGMEIQEVVDIARAKGLEVTSLCGYTWVPKLNPEKFPVCHPCIEIAGDLMRGMGE